MANRARGWNKRQPMRGAKAPRYVNKAFAEAGAFLAYLRSKVATINHNKHRGQESQPHRGFVGIARYAKRRGIIVKQLKDKTVRW